MVLGNNATRVVDEPGTKPCIFTDLDGTLWPLDTPRNKVAAPREVIDSIKRIGLLIVATSKDCPFAMRVIPEADAYICVNGAEIVAKNHIVLDREVVEKQKLLETLLNIAKDLDAFIEEKRSLTGLLIGFSVDWSGKARPDLTHLVAKAEEHGFNIYEPRGGHFLDVYASHMNKGIGVRLIKQFMCGESPIVYIGDGENDLPGFAEADLRILIRHEYNTHLSVPGAIEIRRDQLLDIINNIVTTRFNTTK